MAKRAGESGGTRMAGVNDGEVLIAGRCIAGGSPRSRSAETRIRPLPSRFVFRSLLGLLLLSGCESSETVETQLYIAELETAVAQLEGDLNAAYQEVSRLSGLLTTQVASLEGSVNDVNLRVLDLPSAADPAMGIREVEAAVAVTMRRVAELKGTTQSLADYLQ